MPISHAHRCIFIHIPKTGGTSIERALGMRGRNKKEDRELLYGRIESNDLKRQALLSGYLQHITMADIHTLYPERPFADYFSFSVVRNPWDRLVSTYVNTDRHLCRTARARGVELEGLTFDDYVRAVGELRHAHLQPQHEYLLDEHGKLAVGYVGRFESLVATFGEICQQLGIRKVLSHEKRSSQRKSKDHRSYYSPETKKIVEKRYARDIELFGYHF